MSRRLGSIDSQDTSRSAAFNEDSKDALAEDLDLIQRRRATRAASDRSDVTPELTGTDASPDEAARGDAGSGASPWGADLSGVPTGPDDQQMRTDLFEDEAENRDIYPDHLEQGVAQDEGDEREITARPHHPARPITADMLASDDPTAQE